MPDNTRHGQATAFVNALQHILDTLVNESTNEEITEEPVPVKQTVMPENTYELFVDMTDRRSLSTLLICITLVSALHRPDDPGGS